MEFGQKRYGVAMRRAGFRRFAGEIQLHPIARRKQDRLGLRIAIAETGQRFGGLLAAEGEPLSDFERRRTVAATDHAEVHDSASCTDEGVLPRPCCEPPTRSRAITRARNRKLATVR